MPLYPGPVPIIGQKRERELSEFKVNLNPVGTTGTKIFSGLISEEYLEEWNTVKKRVTIINRMLSSDATIKALQHTIELPIRSALFDLTFPPEADKYISKYIQDEIIDGLKRNLFEEMELSFDDHIRQGLQAIFYGFYPFEVVHMLDDDVVKIKDISPRMPSTLYKWDLNEKGKLRGMWQQAPFPKGTRTEYKTVFIPIDNMCLYTYRQQGNNFEGESILRACYKHWYFKDKIYIIQGIGIERNSVGEPVFVLPPNFTEAMQKYAENLIKTWRVHEEGGAVIPPGGELRTHVGGMDSQAIQYAIQHHDTEITKAVLAHFVNLGVESRGGAFSLGIEMTDFFMLGLKATGNWFCDNDNKQIIKPVVLMNYPGLPVLPRLSIKELGRIDRAGFANMLATLVNSRLLTPDKELEKWSREIFDIPAMGEVATSIREGQGTEATVQTKQLLDQLYGPSPQEQMMAQQTGQPPPPPQYPEKPDIPGVDTDSPPPKDTAKKSYGTDPTGNARLSEGASIVQGLLNLREELIAQKTRPLNIMIGDMKFDDFLANVISSELKKNGRYLFERCFRELKIGDVTLSDKYIDSFALEMGKAVKSSLSGSDRQFNDVIASYKFKYADRDPVTGEFKRKEGSEIRNAVEKAVYTEAKRSLRVMAGQVANQVMAGLPVPDYAKRFTANVARNTTVNLASKPMKDVIRDTMNNYIDVQERQTGGPVVVPMSAVPMLVSSVNQQLPRVVEGTLPEVAHQTQEAAEAMVRPGDRGGYYPPPPPYYGR
jgi:hypothetical protein